MSLARIIVHGCGHSFHTGSMLPASASPLFVSNSWVLDVRDGNNDDESKLLRFLICLRSSQREEVDDILIGENDDDSDEAVPIRSKGVCVGGQNLEILPSAILTCQSDSCNDWPS